MGEYINERKQGHERKKRKCGENKIRRRQEKERIRKVKRYAMDKAS